MKYKNVGPFTEIQYGLVAKPGDIIDVPGIIMSKNFSVVYSNNSKNIKADIEKPAPKRRGPRKKSNLVEPSIQIDDIPLDVDTNSIADIQEESE